MALLPRVIRLDNRVVKWKSIGCVVDVGVLVSCASNLVMNSDLLGLTNSTTGDGISHILISDDTLNSSVQYRSINDSAGSQGSCIGNFQADMPCTTHNLSMGSGHTSVGTRESCAASLYTLG